jgi:phosphoglycerol geranylgeranyltransferase
MVQTNYFTSANRALAVLVDPDKSDNEHLDSLLKNDALVDFYFVGGSLVTDYRFDEVVTYLKANSSKPVVLFPGSGMHISKEADAILFLSLISGRNPEYLIGQQVQAAPRIRAAKLDVIPTGYMLIDGGNVTTASYISNTFPIPSEKNDVAACTAIAGEMLGLSCIYLDGGSGAKNVVPAPMIEKVRSSVQVPIIVGGGIKTVQQAKEVWDAGANIVVIGTAFEADSDFIKEFH